MCHDNTQVEFEFGFRWIIFGRVMPLGLIKIQLIISSRSLSPLLIDILNWNSEYRCVKRIRKVEFEFGSSRIIFGRIMPLGLRKIPIICHNNTQVKFRCGSIFSFRSLSPLLIDILNWNSVYRCVKRISRLSLNLGRVE